MTDDTIVEQLFDDDEFGCSINDVTYKYLKSLGIIEI